MKPITYQGTTFTSYQKTADYIGITKAGFAKRYQKYQAHKISLEELFSPENFHLTNPITYHGKVFKNHPEAAKFIGITLVSFNRRFKKYELGELSLDELFHPSKYTIYELPSYHGKKFASKQEAAKYLGINQNTFTKRLRFYHEGKYTVEDVFASTPYMLKMRKTKSVPIHYKGRTFRNQHEASQYLGIAQSTFSMRYQRYLAGTVSLDYVFRHGKHRPPL
ncbi:hypothetical protein G8J22_02426 [Lentilactobacillus hilgardii]|uniref:NUMOD1 domain-containing DNA-binding protein n=1 Tax=Lentilactobacillus hilgardii TaxID=1588 RepID=UPI00019C5BE6|nr:NUMOD1 domain-containing DNA-binding protein [Lentilactobacillus hilgardii]EEI19594.1 hypothetical protein HMPREF0497_1579 [Lentilactobacillus buchneri ATCC 11577]QIR10418.1 hypothetical protein G8J22_02426 [Lentilactobacillus hilgardii]